jgi:hypothetical protein
MKRLLMSEDAKDMAIETKRITSVIVGGCAKLNVSQSSQFAAQSL